MFCYPVRVVPAHHNIHALYTMYTAFAHVRTLSDMQTPELAISPEKEVYG